MNSIIYIVTKGRYSDYSIYGAFAEKQLAEEYAAQISDKYDTAQVEEHTVKTTLDLPVPVGFRTYMVLMDQDGNVDIIDQEISQNNDAKNENGWADIANDKFEDGKYKFVQTGKYHFYVITDKNTEGAIKIANERRTQMIANNTWPIQGVIIEI